MNIIVYLKEKAEARFKPEIRHKRNDFTEKQLALIEIFVLM